MAGMSQTQSMSQMQVLAPQLQQSLVILQAPMLELRSIIAQEMETNPTLEETSPEPDPTEDPPQPDDNFDQEFEQLRKLDDEWREYMAQSGSYSSRSEDEAERRQFFFDSLANPESLQQHLMEQLPGAEMSSDELKIAELIIGNIDDSGFLQTTPEEMEQNTGIAAADAQRVLDVIQAFHPAGVGARDLRECLLLQLRRQGREKSLEAQIIDRFLEDLGKRRFPEIARKLGVTVQQVQAAANAIAILDPRPGQIFAALPNNYVIPDVNVEKIQGEWIITLNSDQIPHLRISNTYKDLMAKENSGGDVREYIREKIRSGKFLIKSIHQRQQTILNIAREIVKRQGDFLEHGSSQLRPLTMVQIADAVGVHETTVSRAISGKYISTPQGVYEMRYFFTPGYQTASGEVMSNTSVKEAILDLIKAESSSTPLSDKEVVAILEKRGIPIARRTVAKYRNELNILPSNLRKEY